MKKEKRNKKNIVKIKENRNKTLHKINKDRQTAQKVSNVGINWFYKPKTEQDYKN